MDFKKLDMGGKLILGSAVVAILSLFFAWAEFIISVDGFQQDAYLFLIVFIYPVVAVVRNKPLNKVIGYVCAAAGVLLGLWYINSKATVMGESIAASGPYVFIIASALLAFGVWKHRKAV
ncbi:hypothetical protein [Marinicrinis sediminis]|uniref:Uncharacterized protein n=1 Tax=Marinicrinis sediminis TaxID=1652465 RepID=A0ABW5RCA2_9BACL